MHSLCFCIHNSIKIHFVSVKDCKTYRHCTKHKMCFILPTTSVQNTFCSDSYLVSCAQEVIRNACKSSCVVSIIVVQF
jgi:hypothetical protein